MQNAKDTFFESLRTRLATVNPERTAVVRSAVRPAVIVEANELAADAALPDCFRLRWVSDTVETAGAMPLVTMQCEIAYETAGTALNAGMDRGRVLSAMDAELAAMVNLAPQRALKHDYDRGIDLATEIWWGAVEFGEVSAKAGRLARVAKVAVMSYEEAGER
jgi:hypothetical protein